VQQIAASFGQLAGASEQSQQHAGAKRLCGFEVDGDLVSGGLLDQPGRWLFVIENVVDALPVRR